MITNKIIIYFRKNNKHDEDLLHIVLYVVTGYEWLSNGLSTEDSNTSTIGTGHIPPIHTIDDFINWKIDDLNITDIDSRFILQTQLKYCPSIFLCNTSSVRYVRTPCCRSCMCTTDCYAEGSCCPDLLLTSSDNYQPRETCFVPQLKPYNYQLSRFLSYSYYMVYKCSSNYTVKTIKKQCEDIINYPDNFSSFLSHIPASSNFTNITYRNQYCALCNYENENNIVIWKAQMSCPKELYIFPNSLASLLQFLKNENECNMFFTPGYVSKEPNGCYGGEITRCNQTGEMQYYDKRLDYGCNLYTSLYNHRYRNVFCYMCNHNDEPKSSNCGPGGFIPPFDVASFTALLDFNVLKHLDKSAENTAPMKSDRNCSFNQLYDPYKNICHDILCSPGFVYVNNTCKSVYADEGMRTYEVLFKLKTTNNCISDIKCHANEIKIWFFKEFLSQRLYDTMCGIRIAAETNNNTTCEKGMTYTNFFLVYIKLGYDYPHHIEDVIHKIQSFENGTVNIEKQSMKCNFWQPESYQIQLNSDYDPNVTGNVDILDEPSPFKTNDLRSCNEDLRLIQIRGNMLCPGIALSRRIYNFSSQGNLVCIADTNICFEEASFTSNTDEIIICSDVYFSQLSDEVIERKYLDTQERCPKSDNTYLQIVSFVFTSLSIVCLIITIGVYSRFEELRTIPGKNNMALCINLLVAQLLFQFGFGQTTLDAGCKVIGIAVHFFWLSSMFWMNSCTIHMFRVFVRLSRKTFTNHKNEKWKIIFYGLYSHGLSMCFILANIISRLVITGGDDIGYGGCVCYISTKVMIGLTFALPVGIIVLVNFSLFVAVIVSIQRVPNVTESPDKNKKSFLIYVKLSCITGLSWTFGFIYQLFQVEPLAYIFIILNAGQGIYIMISFIYNKRVLNLLRTKCCVQCAPKSEKSRSDTNKTLSTSENSTKSSGNSTKSKTDEKVHKEDILQSKKSLGILRNETSLTLNSTLNAHENEAKQPLRDILPVRTDFIHNDEIKRL